VGRAALKLTRSSWTAALAALAYGVAMPTLVVSIEVRGTCYAPSLRCSPTAASSV